MSDPIQGPETSSPYINGDGNSNSIIVALQQSLDQANAELRRIQIESESDLNESNTQVLQLQSKLDQQSNLRTQLDDSLKEVEQLKERLKNRVGGEDQCQKRVEKLESEKIKLLEVISDSQKDIEDLQAESQSKLEELKACKIKSRELESQLVNSREAERSLRLHNQAIEANAGLITSDRDFYVKELEEARAASHKLRTDSYQEISRVQTELDKLKHAHEHLTGSHTILQAQHSDLQRYHSDALEKIKDLTHRNIEAEASFKKEIDQQKRVVELMDDRDKHRDQRIKDFEAEWERKRAESVEKEKILEEELTKEKAQTAQLQKQLTESKTVFDSFCASHSTDFDFADEENSIGNITLGSTTPGSPLHRRQRKLTLLNTLSPAATMVNNLQKNGKSLSSIYSEKIKLEEQLADARNENVALADTLATIMGEMEDRGPIIQQKWIEAERIQAESDRLTTELTHVIEEKEEAERKYESCLIDLKASQRDHDLANLQLHDLSVQIRGLMKELVIRDRGDKYGLAGNEDDLITRVESEEINLEDEADDLLVSNDLVTFKDITELQHKNLKLLGVARSLTTKLEELEADRAVVEEEGEDQSTSKAVEEAHELIIELKSQLVSSERKAEALYRERDMLRRQLVTQSQQTIYSSETSQSKQDPASISENNRQFEDVRIQFEAYKTEMAADSKRVNDDLNRSRAELSQSQVSLAKANAQIDYLNERHRNFDQTNAIQAQEIQRLSQKSIQFQEQLIQSEARLHQASDSVTELQSQCTVLQHQVNTLKTEKEVWRGTEARLNAENSNLTRERNSLSDILSNMQSMKAELDRSSSDGRHRMENQITKLESRVQELQDKLRSEYENVKQITLQRELDNRDFQARLDRLNVEHSAARESVIAARATQEVLEAKVKELSKELSVKADRLQVYEGHSSGSANWTGNGDANVDGSSSLSPQQKLEIENSSLRRELASVKEDLIREREHVEKFKEIAESAEASLESLTASHDQFKSSQEADLAQKQNLITVLKDEAKKLAEDLATALTSNRELQQNLDTQIADHESEKVRMQVRLASLEDVEARTNSQEKDLREEVARHRTLANENHQRYQAEVQNHAISINQLDLLKEQLENARAKIATANTSADTAIAKLKASEASWAEQKATLEKEVENVTKRWEDLTQQNKLLYEHLETVSAQAAQISHNAMDSAAGGLPSSGPGEILGQADENSAQSIETLRELISHLRRSLDISEQQMSLTKMESTRLNQQLQACTKELDHTRSELNQERERSRQGYVPSSEFKQLLEKVNLLNVVRESNATLRDENHRLDRKVKDLEARLQKANAALEPLEAELREKKVVVEQYRQEIGLLTEDNERWKTRNSQILEKYDRIDPAEVQSLRDQITDLTRRLNEEAVESEARRVRFLGVRDQARDVRKRYGDEIIVLKEEKKQLETKVQELEQTAEQLREEKSGVEKSLAEAAAYQIKVVELQSLLDQAKAEAEKQQASLDTLTSTNATLMTHNRKFLAEKNQLSAEIEETKASLAQASAAVMSEELIEAEVSKRVLAALPSNPPVTDSTTASTQEAHHKQLQEARELAASEKQQEIEELTQRLTKEKEDAITQLRLELSKSNTAAPEAFDKATDDLVAQKLALLKAQWDVEIENKLRELTAQHEGKLQEREAQHQLELKKAVEGVKREGAGVAVPAPLQAVCYTQEQHQEAVDQAVEKAKLLQVAELSQSHQVEKDAAIETVKKQSVAESNSKSNAIKQQLARAREEIMKLKKIQGELELQKAELTQRLTKSGPVPAPVPSVSSADAVMPASAPLSGVPVGQTIAVSTSSPADTLTAVAPLQDSALANEPAHAPSPSATRDATSSARSIPPKPLQSTTAITFGPGKPASALQRGNLRGGRAGSTRGTRGVTRGAIGRAVTTAQPAPGTSVGDRNSATGKVSLPAEGRMLTKPDSSNAVPAAFAIRGTSSIKGVSKRGGMGGGGSILEAAMKAATSGTSTSNEPSVSDGTIAGSAASLGIVAGKRLREDDAMNSLVGTEEGEILAKRSKATNTGVEDASAKVPGDLAARLSKPPP